jgi:GGDEF domain-containing protein
MTLTYILPWFPVVLAVGVGAHLLNAARGLGLGILGAVFWVILVLAGIAPESWSEPLSVTSLVAGAAAIVAVGAWAGRDTGIDLPATGSSPKAAGRSVPTALLLVPVAEVIERFARWLNAHRDLTHPWGEFDEFLRSLLYDTIHATHVRPLQVAASGELVPLRSAGEVEYHDPFAPALGSQPEAWSFDVLRAGSRIGAISVGRFDSARVDQPGLDLMRALVSQFWVTLVEVERCRTAERLDPASELLTRDPFLAEAGEALHRTYANGEPVAVAVFALEGLRAVTDRGHWNCADALIAEISRILRQRCRTDDCLARFDDARFVLLLTRVDAALANLIANQLVGKLNALLAGKKDLTAGLVARVGVAASADATPGLVELVAEAVAKCHDARRAAQPLSSPGQQTPEATDVALAGGGAL